MRRRVWLVFAMLIAFALAAQAAGSRAILLIWDSASDKGLATHIKLVERLKSLRSAGHFAKVSGLDKSIKLYDCAQAAHLKNVTALGCKRSDTPYIAVVSMGANGVPSKVNWGLRVESVDSALQGLDKHLGLATPVSPTVPVTVNTNPPDSSRKEQVQDLFVRAQAQFSKQNYAQAIPIFDQAIALAPSPLLYTRRGICRLRTRNRTGGLDDLARALAIDPRFTEALWTRAAEYYDAGQFAEALPDLNQLVQIDPRNVTYLTYRGDTLRCLGKQAPAQQDLDAALALAPGDVVCLRSRGALSVDKDEAEKAFTDLNKALKIEPNSVFGLYQRGRAYLLVKAYQEALTDLNRAVELNPKSFWSLFHRARAFEGMARWADAIADLDRAQQIDPGAAFVIGNRGYYRYCAGDNEGAMRDTNEAIRLQPTTPRWLNNRALIWDRLNEPDKAATDRAQARALSSQKS